MKRLSHAITSEGAKKLLNIDISTREKAKLHLYLSTLYSIVDVDALNPEDLNMLNPYLVANDNPNS